MTFAFKNNNWKWVSLAGIILASFIAIKLSFIITSKTPKRPNLLLITLDTLRPDHLNSYGYERLTSPAITKLVEDSFIMDKAFTVATNSGPSHATLLTGLYPAQHGLQNNGQKIKATTPTLAEILRQAGYNTAGFVGYFALAEESGLNKGFEEFEINPIASHDHDHKEPEDDLQGFEAVADWLKSWAESAEKPPFFIWMHVQNIHESYDPPAPYSSMFGEISAPQTLAGFEGEFDVRCINDLAKAWRAGILPPRFKDEMLALYDGEIRLVDDQLEKIFNGLKSSGNYDDTIIVLVSDHGEVLFEKYENKFYKQGPGHTGRYSDASLRVPLILKPATFHGFKKTSRITQMVSTVDLVPTLLDLIGLPVTKNLPGASLVPVMRLPEKYSIPKNIFFHEKPYGVEYTGVRSEQWKFVHKLEKGRESFLLIDLVGDPKENHFNDSASQVKAFKSLLETWKKKNQSIHEQQRMTEEMRQALIEGGYIRK